MTRHDVTNMTATGCVLTSLLSTVGRYVRGVACGHVPLDPQAWWSQVLPPRLFVLTRQPFYQCAVEPTFCCLQPHAAAYLIQPLPA